MSPASPSSLGPGYSYTLPPPHPGSPPAASAARSRLRRHPLPVAKSFRETRPEPPPPGHSYACASTATQSSRERKDVSNQPEKTHPSPSSSSLGGHFDRRNGVRSRAGDRLDKRGNYSDNRAKDVGPSSARMPRLSRPNWHDRDSRYGARASPYLSSSRRPRWSHYESSYETHELRRTDTWERHAPGLNKPKTLRSPTYLPRSYSKPRHEDRDNAPNRARRQSRYPSLSPGLTHYSRDGQRRQHEAYWDQERDRFNGRDRYYQTDWSRELTSERWNEEDPPRTRDDEERGIYMEDPEAAWGGGRARTQGFTPDSTSFRDGKREKDARQMLLSSPHLDVPPEQRRHSDRGSLKQRIPDFAHDGDNYTHSSTSDLGPERARGSKRDHEGRKIHHTPSSQAQASARDTEPRRNHTARAISDCPPENELDAARFHPRPRLSIGSSVVHDREKDMGKDDFSKFDQLHSQSSTFVHQSPPSAPGNLTPRRDVPSPPARALASPSPPATSRSQSALNLDPPSAVEFEKTESKPSETKSREQSLSPPPVAHGPLQRTSWTIADLIDEASSQLASELHERFLLDLCFRFCRPEMNSVLQRVCSAPRHAPPSMASTTVSTPKPALTTGVDPVSTAETSPDTAAPTPMLLPQEKKDEEPMLLAKQMPSTSLSFAYSHANVPSFKRKLPSVPKVTGSAKSPTEKSRPSREQEQEQELLTRKVSLHSRINTADMLSPLDTNSHKSSYEEKSLRPSTRWKRSALVSDSEEDSPNCENQTNGAIEEDLPVSKKDTEPVDEPPHRGAPMPEVAPKTLDRITPNPRARSQMQSKARNLSLRRTSVPSSNPEEEASKSQRKFFSSSKARSRTLPDFTDSDSDEAGHSDRTVNEPPNSAEPGSADLEPEASKSSTLTSEESLFDQHPAPKSQAIAQPSDENGDGQHQDVVDVTTGGSEAFQVSQLKPDNSDATASISEKADTELVPQVEIPVRKKRGRPSRKQAETTKEASDAPADSPAPDKVVPVSSTRTKRPARVNVPRSSIAASNLYTLGIIEDEEDLYFAKKVLEDMKALEDPSLIPEKTEKSQSREESDSGHFTGSTRSEGMFRVNPRHKILHVPQFQEDLPDTRQGTGAGQVASAREARADGRRLVANLELQKRDFTIDSDLLTINQLRTRKKALRFAKSRIHDWGLYALEPIPPGDMVIEYVGELVRHQVADEREKAYERSGQFSTYLFRVDDDLVVDATRKGNIARLMNHCCTPNCTAKILTVNGEKRIVLFAKVWIEPGSEITYDYKLAANANDEDAIPCLCGSEGCRKFL